ncbi:DUF924 family protein [Hirschia litorea]|uniref:DUF924 family protein n=1 Tax=Hirschia litorea TaxID=1199156 RepID=A0ABW2IJS7_9PROT
MFTDNAMIGRNMLEHKRATRPLQSPGDVLNFWFEDAATNPEKLSERNSFWWNGDEELDRLIASRSLKLLARLASGLGQSWAERGPAERLASIIALDQFTRSIFRDTPYAFENDPLALELCKEGLAQDEDKGLAPIKRYFFYMPLMHSENIDDQDKCVSLFASLIEDTDDAYIETIRNGHKFAVKHRDVIAQYGRFPHRNKVLERTSTHAETDYLSRPGAGF